jgi:hypothetical protein
MIEGESHAKRMDAERKRTTRPLPYFILSVAYLVVLLAGALVYIWIPSVQSSIPGQIGPVPIGVPWWGATGAVTIS